MAECTQMKLQTGGCCLFFLSFFVFLLVDFLPLHNVLVTWEVRGLRTALDWGTCFSELSAGALPRQGAPVGAGQLEGIQGHHPWQVCGEPPCTWPDSSFPKAFHEPC